MTPGYARGSGKIGLQRVTCPSTQENTHTHAASTNTHPHVRTHTHTRACPRTPTHTVETEGSAHLPRCQSHKVFHCLGHSLPEEADDDTTRILIPNLDVEIHLEEGNTPESDPTPSSPRQQLCVRLDSPQGRGGIRPTLASPRNNRKNSTRHATV